MKNRHQRKLEKIRKADRRLRIIQSHGYAPHLGYVDEAFEGHTLYHSGCYIRYPRKSNQRRCIKRASAKRTRRQTDLHGKGNQYRRSFDLWWTLY